MLDCMKIIYLFLNLHILKENKLVHLIEDEVPLNCPQLKLHTQPLFSLLYLSVLNTTSQFKIE